MVHALDASVSSPDEAPGRELKFTTRNGVFLTNFQVFHMLMKHCVECLILLLKQNDFRRKKIRIHLISKHSVNTHFLYIFFMNY